MQARTLTPQLPQMIVTLEPDALVSDLRKAMKMMRGVASVKMQKPAVAKPKEFDVTKTASFREAMEDVKHGRVTSYESVEDMFQKLNISL